MYEENSSPYISTYKAHEGCDYANLTKAIPHLFPTAPGPAPSYVLAPEPASVGLPEQGDPPFR